MMDQDAIERRERIFIKLREEQIAYQELSNQYELLQNQIGNMRVALKEKRTKTEDLVKLIKVMIMHDCCPVEAQLQYPDELEDEDDKNSKAGYQTAYGIGYGDDIISEQKIKKRFRAGVSWS